MKQALIFIDEIKRKIEAIENTRSFYLKNDYSKSVQSDIQELKAYCRYKGIKFAELKKELQNI